MNLPPRTGGRGGALRTGFWACRRWISPGKPALGALAHYVSNPTVVDFQPMNINFGIIPPLGYKVKGKRNKNAASASVL